MRDFLPAEKARREHALAVIRRVYAQHGFDEVETPVMEDSRRLHAGLGGDNEKLAFGVLRRGLSADDLQRAADAATPQSLCDLGLRFDLTVPLARFYATQRAALPGVFRSVQIGPVWRAERPQKGRYRQFVQADIDIIGEPGALAEIELITATSAALSELGLRDCVIRLNDRRLLSALMSHCGFPEAQHADVLISVDKLDKIGVAGVIADLADSDPAHTAALAELLTAMEPHAHTGGVALTPEAMAAVLPADLGADAVTALVQLGAALGSLPPGVSVRFDPTLVRGMGYYTGTIFEISHPASGSSVGGGGRYDGMIGRFLGQDVPAVGFSIGFERIVDLLPQHASMGVDAVALLYAAGTDPAALLRLKAALVARGLRVRLEARAKNAALQLARLAEQGFGQFATVTADSAASLAAEDLVLRPLGD